MSAEFDPYQKWLGIPRKHQPPNHYRLLGIELFECDPETISHAADRQMSHVRSFQSGKNAAISQRLLNEISAARICLLDAPTKLVYDAELRATLITPDAPMQPMPAPIQPRPLPMAKPIEIQPARGLAGRTSGTTPINLAASKVRFRVSGADAQNGQERTICIEAVDERAALFAAKVQGIFPTRVERIPDTTPSATEVEALETTTVTSVESWFNNLSTRQQRTVFVVGFVAVVALVAVVYSAACQAQFGGDSTGLTMILVVLGVILAIAVLFGIAKSAEKQAEEQNAAFDMLMQSLEKEPLNESVHAQVIGFIQLHPNVWSTHMYHAALQILAAHPNSIAARTLALESGRIHYRSLRANGELTIYDEQALQNDIFARSHGQM